MCLMPFVKDSGERESKEYCSYCFRDGKLLGAELTLAEFQDVSFRSMRKSGLVWPLAKVYAFSIRFAPYWRTKDRS